ncbi:S1 family peptidase [Ponticaulis profundi]|uniref:S1 family peptidase n=1 Tax=Ponticaulis profundi TaxID=2665222 RepID=A0ABW1SBB2_9PROT
MFAMKRVTALVASGAALGLIAFAGVSMSPAGIPEQQMSAKLTTPNLTEPVDAALKPCGPLLSVDHQPFAASAHTRTLATSYATPWRNFRRMNVPASDLPGIVKLEPEVDISPTEVAKGHCSATRISTEWFVTAAHCVSEGYDRVYLKAGSEQLSSDAIRSVKVDFAVCHGGFGTSSDQFDNDIALLKVAEEDLNLIDAVPVVSWGHTSTPFSTVRFRTARVGGWGLMSFGGELSDHLQKMELDIFSIEKKLIRISSRAGRGPCIGDSGGPLIVEDDGKPVLMGVLSTVATNRQGEMCAGNYMSSYTNLSTYRDWAINTMVACEQNADACKRT